MSAHTQNGAPEQPASPSVNNTVHGYLAGVGAGAALLAAAVLAFMVLVGMVSFNLWPQATPRAPAGAAELSAPAQAGAEFASSTLAATLVVSVGSLAEDPEPPSSRQPDRSDPTHPAPTPAPAPPAPGEKPATGEDQGGAIAGEGGPDRGGEVSGGAPRGWTQGGGNGYGRGKARGSGGDGKPSSGPSRQGTKTGRHSGGRRNTPRAQPTHGSSGTGAKAPSSRGSGKGGRE